jgi:hypothetical protein
LRVFVGFSASLDSIDCLAIKHQYYLVSGREG